MDGQLKMNVDPAALRSELARLFVVQKSKAA
jgi:hypothetical protein